MDPGRLRKVREACRNNFHLFSSKSIARIPSYDQKPSEINAEKSNAYFNVSAEKKRKKRKQRKKRKRDKNIPREETNER